MSRSEVPNHRDGLITVSGLEVSRSERQNQSAKNKKTIAPSSRGGLVVERWSDNRLDSITVDRIPLEESNYMVIDTPTFLGMEVGVSCPAMVTYSDMCYKYK